MFLGRYHRIVVARPDKRCSRVILLVKLVRTQVHIGVWSEVCTTNGLFNTVFKVCVFPLLNVVRNSTKIAPWSLPMILFVWSTVWYSLVIFRMSCLAPASSLNSWSSWLWSRNSSPFPPARLTFLRWMKFVSRVTGVGQFGPICPRGKNLESHGSDLLVLKSFRKFCSHS